MGSLKMNRQDEKLCLKWNDFQENAISAFGTLRDDKEFSDVTLACEDGQQMEVHKVVLAASSPFFQNILTKNKHPHPLIYMRGMKSEDLVAIMDFLYYGEAKVYQESVNTFMAIAEKLELKGLAGNTKTVCAKEEVNSSSALPDTSGSNKVIKFENNLHDETGEILQQPAMSEQTETADNMHRRDQFFTVSNYVVSKVNITNLEELDKQVLSMMRKGDNLCRNGSRKADICTVCGKEGQSYNIKEHIEVNHLYGVAIPCPSCEKTFRTRQAIRRHTCIYEQKTV